MFPFSCVVYVHNTVSGMQTVYNILQMNKMSGM